MNKINVTQSSMPDFNDYVEEIKGLWDSKWLTNNGEKHQRFENNLCEFLDIENISLFTNGHLALEHLIEALDLSGEIITTPFTFISSTHAIVRNGLKPVFCDINSENYTINVNKIEELITDQTSAILAVHVYGNVCDVEKIEAIADKYNLKVIYDAAHAFNVIYNEINISNYGDASMFSFHATKVFHTIEGGAITTKNKELKIKLDKLKNFGISGQEEVEYIGGNAKMNEFQAAMGICNLRNINDEIKKREKIVNKYNEILSNIKGIKLIEKNNAVKSNFAYYPIRFENYKCSRDDVFEKLKENNIFSRKYFYPLTSSFECYNGEFDINDTPVAKNIAENILILPLYSDMKIEDVNRICQIILS